MIAKAELQDLYFRNFADLERRLSRREPSWLLKIRKAAMDRFGELGFPGPRVEEWKYTSVAPLTRIPFRPAADYLPPSNARQPKEPVRPYLEDCIPLHFFNGQFVEEMTPSNTLPPGVKVGSLAKALRNGSGLIEQHFARYAGYEKQPFVALNTAFAEDGALIEIAKNVVLKRPIYLRFMAGPATAPIVYNARNLILLGEGSQATVVEQYLSANQDDENLYFTNAVTEGFLGENAKLDYIKEQDESRKAFHIATVQFQQERSSIVHTHSIAFGSALAREDMNSVLNGEGSECLLNGLYVTTGSQHVDNHTTIDHAKPHCSSRELYKGVLDGRSTGVFNGKIVVRKDAQKTDSKQSNKNLLLADECVINTKPQLEIYADDVKCTHGATIGQIDAESIFYLRSRGIGLEEARTMLTQAFAYDVISKIKSEPLRARMEKTLVEKLARKAAVDHRGVLTRPDHFRMSTLHER